MATNEREIEAFFKRLEKRLDEIAHKVAEAKAYDVRQTAQRSIKAGGKSESSKNWRVSKPDEPPASHSGRLKQSIRVEKTDETYIVGAPATSGSQTAKTLEYGGQGKKTMTTLTGAYFKRRFGRRKKGAVARPKTAKPYRVYSANRPNGKIVREYLRFSSRSAWGKAKSSSAFQRWAQAVITTSTLRFPVAARPFIRPALASVSEPGKEKNRWERIARLIRN